MVLGMVPDLEGRALVPGTMFPTPGIWYGASHRRVPCSPCTGSIGDTKHTYRPSSILEA